MPESRSHYQLSFTSRQAVVFFVVCLFGLGLSFFLGLMTGLSGRPQRPRSGPSAAAQTTPARGEEASGDAPGEPAVTPKDLAPEPAAAVVPTLPAVLHAFDDQPAEPTPAPAPVSRPASGTTAAAASGTWIQVASLGSRGDADALAGRLTRHGYRAQTEPAQSPKGTVYRVRVGPYRSEDEAAHAVERLRRQERIQKPWIVHGEH